MSGRKSRSKGKGRGRAEATARVDDYRYDDTRKNNPPVGLAGYDAGAREPVSKRYAYDPHLSPQLVWAGKPGLTEIEVEDAAGVEVETVPLHIHERVSTRAILDAVRRPEPKQLDLFADPQLPLGDAVKFYQHDVDWANRLILGDSLVVMNSLLERELLAGKVQMIYLDPPYGVKYSSNFQPRINQRDVRDNDDSLSREPEMIKAYRDTWTLGVHSYLTYLRDRLRIARELLSESGSIFVQIGDENVHLVRALMDEVFGAENAISLITFFKTAVTTTVLPSVADYVLWYAKQGNYVKYKHLYFNRQASDDANYRFIEAPDGSRRPLNSSELRAVSSFEDGLRLFSPNPLTSQSSGQTTIFPYEVDGTTYRPGKGGWKTNRTGMERLHNAGRLMGIGQTLRFVRFFDDFPYQGHNNVWQDTRQSGFGEPKIYAVQTATRVIERCLLMTTDPGDLVLDPTCGSGTTAYVAEQWGRRWITIDTSRVALSLARQRILTATFPYYKLADPQEGVDGGFVYKTVPHVTLKSIANNTRIDPVAERYAPLIEAAEQAGDEERARQLKLERKREIDRIIAEDAEQETLYDQPLEERGVVRVSGPFTVEAIPPAVLSIEAESPIGGAPEPNGGHEPVAATISVNGHGDGASIIALLIDLLREDGVTFPGNRKLHFSDLRPVDAGVLHAEGEASEDADLGRIAVSFGPQHGAVSVLQVDEALRNANRGGYDAVIFAGFAFQAEAQQAISADPHPRVKAFMSHIRPDVIMTDARGESLLKTTANNQLFSVFGEPDVTLAASDDSTFSVTLEGVDIYDPISGQVDSAGPNQIAAWFLDTDYDSRCFAICQAFFPGDAKAWQKLERALKGTLDEERFEQFTGHVSLPFQAGRHRRVAVKVIDQRGNEVMRVLPLDSTSSYG